MLPWHLNLALLSIAVLLRLLAENAMGCTSTQGFLQSVQNTWTSARLPELKLSFNGFCCDVHVIWSMHLRSVSQIWQWQLEYSCTQYTLHSFLMPCFLQCDIQSTLRQRDANWSAPAESGKLKLYMCRFINKTLAGSERKSRNKQEQDMTRCKF